MKRSEQLREQALALYAEARAIYRSGPDKKTMARYREKYLQAHAMDMAFRNAQNDEWRRESQGRGN